MSKHLNVHNNRTLKGLPRREFLKIAGLGGAAATVGLGSSTVLASSSTKPPLSGIAKNLIFLVSDGMSAGTFSTADQFLRWRDGRDSNWVKQYYNPYARHSAMDMASANNLVTDSGAASSSWGCGQRVPNGRINVGGDGTEFEPILSVAKRNGKSTGLVTTTTISHATPAGFAANNERRGNQREICEQYLEREIDVLMGGGTGFLRQQRDGAPDLRPLFTEKGYNYIRNRTDLLNPATAKSEKILAVFEDASLPHEMDRLNDEDIKASVPSLAEMSKVAFESLAQNPEGFIVQVEAARVDHAAHGNDIGGVLFDQLAFDDAIQVALDFQEAHPDTMIIITTDHGTGNPSLNVGGNEGETAFSRISQFKVRGNPWRLGFREGEELAVSFIKEQFYNLLGIELSDTHADMIARYNIGEFEQPNDRLNRRYGPFFSQILSNYIHIGWSTDSHTGEYVPLTALGPGSELVKPFIRNYEVFDLMCAATGIA